MTPSGITLDAGALIALERGEPRIRRLLDRAQRDRRPLALPTTVLAQVWRGSPRQAQIARCLLSDADHVEIVDLDKSSAVEVGVKIGTSGHRDIADVHVATCAKRRGHAVATSDRGDIMKIDPELPILDV